MNMKITSLAFKHNQNIPVKYTCDGEGVNPPLEFSGIPNEAKSLALIVDDPDAPTGTFVHWVVYNINPSVKEVKEGEISANSTEYVPSCPPSGTHRYFFKLYALDTLLEIKAKPTKASLEEAMKGHILDQSELIGLYSRK